MPRGAIGGFDRVGTAAAARDGGTRPGLHLPRLRGAGMRKIGEDVAEALEYVPASFKVIRE